MILYIHLLQTNINLYSNMHNPTVHIDKLKVTFAQSSTLLSAQPSPPNSYPSWAQTTTSTTPSMTTPWKTLNYCWSGQNKKPLPNCSTSAEVVAVHKRTLWYICRYECWLRSVVILQNCCDCPYLCNTVTLNRILNYFIHGWFNHFHAAKVSGVCHAPTLHFTTVLKLLSVCM